MERVAVGTSDIRTGISLPIFRLWILSPELTSNSLKIGIETTRLRDKSSWLYKIPFLTSLYFSKKKELNKMITCVSSFTLWSLEDKPLVIFLRSSRVDSWFLEE